MTPTAQMIVEARHQAGLTQPQAAALIGVSTRQWQNFENGTQVMKAVYWFAFQQMIEERK